MHQNNNKDSITLYGTKDIMRIFDMGRDKAYALMRNSSFPSMRVGNRFYITDSSLREWLNTYKGREFKL